MNGKGLKIGIAAQTLQSSGDFRRAGVALYTAGIIDAVVSDPGCPHELHLFVLPTVDLPKEWTEAPNVKVHRTWNRPQRWNVIAAGPYSMALGLDFYFSTSVSIPSLTTVKTGVFVHDLFVMDNPEWFPGDRAEVASGFLAKAIRRSNLVLANSEHTKGRVCSRFPEAADKTLVTYLGPGNKIARRAYDSVSTEDLTRMGVSFEKYIFFISTLEPRKNLSRLFEAFKKITEDSRFNGVGLVVAGGRGWKYEDDLATMDRLGLKDRVALPGYISDDDLPALMARAELFVCPSLAEGFGMPLLEAMAAGVPVVSSNGGALPEVGGDAARYFDPYKPDEIAMVLAEALLDTENREAWIQKGLRQANQFTWESAATKTLQAIEETCGYRANYQVAA